MQPFRVEARLAAALHRSPPAGVAVGGGAADTILPRGG